jgi:CxxC motif-containing protein (DUF1111 family)
MYLRIQTSTLLTFVIATGIGALAQPRDPGIRGGPPGAGQPIAGLTPGELSYFISQGEPQFMQIEAVSDGLGPRFNLDSCGGCHAFPAPGGSSPPVNNPQVVRALIMAPGNTVPRFLALNGPVREVRFKTNPNGTPDGGVHAIFTIAGRTDKPPGCAISQPDFSNSGNIVFRIPTPTFGGGLIEAITDTTIRSNLASDPGGKKAALSIKGHLNTNGNEGTVTRFGWKAQNKSLLIFAGEAYNVEMGVTNEVFPNEREEDPGCAKNGTPENHTGFDGGSDPSDTVGFMAFMKFLDQPVPACMGSGCPPSIQNGHRVFMETGCATCHTETLMTGFSSSAALDHKPVRLFSDLAVHHMGSALADGVVQGSAGPDEFRTAPLWGVGQRAFFLHDGRTSDLMQAILAHDSQGSEAHMVVENFRSKVSSSQQQDLLNFLRSL